jgi:hypothetical protein
MKSDLAIAALIRSRLTELGLSRGEFAKRLGYKNIAKGIRRIEKLLRIDLDPTQGPVSFVRQVLDRLPEGVPAFGKPIGFVINYSPDKAVRFDPNGQPIAILDKAVRPGSAVLRLGGRPIPAEALGPVFGK